MSDPVTSPNALLAAFKAMRAGLDNGLPSGLTQIGAGGKVSTIADVKAELDDTIKVYQAAKDADLEAQKAAKARDEMAPAAVARYEALRTALKGIFGRKSPDLVKVGLAPDKTPAPPTVEEKKARVEKMQATRKARGTKGPKQLKAIKGQVPDPTPPPPAPPAKSGP